MNRVVKFVDDNHYYEPDYDQFFSYYEDFDYAAEEAFCRDFEIEPEVFED